MTWGNDPLAPIDKSSSGGWGKDPLTKIGGTPAAKSAGPESLTSDVLNTFASEPEAAWNQLKSDFEAQLPDKSYVSDSLWGKLKHDFHSTVAAGRLPFDAFNLVTSPLMGLIHAGPVKAVAAGERALIGAAPGIDKSKLPSQGAVENELMGDLSVIGPEKGMSLAPIVAAAAPTIDALRATAKAAYKVVDNSGMRVAPKAISDLHSTITTDLAKQGFHEKLMPKTDVAVSQIKTMAEEKDPVTKQPVPRSLQDIDTLRKIAGHAAGATEKADRNMARVVKDHIDDFVDNLGPQHLVGAKDHAAINAVGEARDAWKRMSKAEIVERAIEKADIAAKSKYTQSGMDNALRAEFRKIAKNDRAMRRFSKDEQAAIKQVATGGPVTNAIRLLGKFAVRGPITGGAAAATGFMFGPAAPFVTAGAGEAARAAGTALTERNARLASELMRRGARAPANPAARPVAAYPGLAVSNALAARPSTARGVADDLNLQQ